MTAGGCWLLPRLTSNKQDRSFGRSARGGGGRGLDRQALQPPCLLLRLRRGDKVLVLETLLRTLAFQLLLVNICTGQFNYEPVWNFHCNSYHLPNQNREGASASCANEMVLLYILEGPSESDLDCSVIFTLGKV